jgi:hypothetical protein
VLCAGDAGPSGGVRSPPARNNGTSTAALISCDGVWPLP